MNVQTCTFIEVSEQAEEVVVFGRGHHWRFRIIPDFHGVIDKPVFNAKGDWVYIPLREEDRKIIPKAAYRRHEAVERAGYRIAQVIIGHEIEITPEEPVSPTKPEQAEQGIDWRNVAEIAGKGVLIGMTGIATVALYALAGMFQLADPSYCIVLDDGAGTVVELIRWNAEA